MAGLRCAFRAGSLSWLREWEQAFLEGAGKQGGGGGRKFLLIAADDPDPAMKQAHTCEANFYSGQYALIQSNRDEAVKLFEAAAKECPHGFLEGIVAAAELKGLGAKL